MPNNIVFRGRKLMIEFAELNNGTVPGRDFLREQPAQQRARLHVLFARLGDEGVIPNRELFKPIEKSGFFEFKRHQIRMPCYFREDKRVVITHGFIKKRDKISAGDLERAKHIKEEYEALLGRLKKES